MLLTIVRSLKYEENLFVQCQCEDPHLRTPYPCRGAASILQLTGNPMKENFLQVAFAPYRIDPSPSERAEPYHLFPKTCMSVRQLLLLHNRLTYPTSKYECGQDVPNKLAWPGRPRR